MSLIEGIGDEVTHFFIFLLAAIIAYFAWWSTNISEQRHFRTVLLLDRRHPSRRLLRIRVPPRQLTNHTETVNITEGASDISTVSVQTEAEPAVQVEEEEETGSLSDGAATSNLEESEIIETMDADTQNEVRRRRLARFGGAGQGDEEIDADKQEQSIGNSGVENVDANEEPEHQACAEKIEKTDNDISIRLKYINDDTKVVDGKLDELLGDFKRRHFLEEINTNKEVKLIFNGHMLKQDRNTLASCGLVDNCVVHCLVHPKRASIAREEQENRNNETQFRAHVIGDPNSNNNNQRLDWDLGNFLFASVSFLLLAAWYFRYLYANLYTISATIGLIILTGVFAIVLLGAYFPDRQVHHGANIRIQVTTRTDRTV